MDIQDIQLKNIKLVIWDLDDTFWKGTLSEGSVFPIKENLKLVKDLTDRGIVNAICSKNDIQPVLSKLKELNIERYFVFNSIDWTPKGERIANMISDMGLRPLNVLFIDDNVVNLSEARYYSDSLMISEPAILPTLARYVEALPVNDKNHSRLERYRILEQKRDSKNQFSDNLAFLFSTDTRVEIKKDCLNQLDRIHELIMRTNQLNFTKNRMSKDELRLLLENRDVDSGYVNVSDKFGDYGIVGFYAIKNSECIHFLFSCRTIGQGVEQYIYSTLGYPQLEIVGDVINQVSKMPPPKWINQSNPKKKDSLMPYNKQVREGKVIFKGPCDLMILTAYLKGSGNIIEEFTYQGEKGNTVEHHNHSVNMLTFQHLSEIDKNMLLDECIFNDKDMFKTAIYDTDIQLAFVSTLQEPHMGIYSRKNKGIKIAFAGYNRPLTDKRYWDHYLSTKQYGCHYTEDWLKSFSENYEFIGRLSPSEVLDNYKSLLSMMSPTACLCLVLGSEIPYEKESSSTFIGREKYHQELNPLLREWARTDSRVYILDWNEYITGQDSFNDTINHFTRDVYYKASLRVRDIIKEVTGQQIKEISLCQRLLLQLREKCWKYLDKDSIYYHYLRDLFHLIVKQK